MISIVMPAHNAEKYIGKAIESILKQTYTDFELIIVNDSSTDNTQEMINYYALLDSRIRPIKCQARNVAGSRNAGIEVARGEYIALMDADDIALPQRLAVQVDAAQKYPDVVVWGCYMQYITPEGYPMGEMKLGPTSHQEFFELDRTESLIDLYGTVAMFRRDVFDEVGEFDPRVVPAEDSEMWDRMADYGPIVVIPEILQLYRQHASSVSASKVVLERHWQSFIKARFKARLNDDTLTIDSWNAQLDSQAFLESIGQTMRGYSQRFGRQSKISFARKHYGLAFSYAVATIVAHPVRFLEYFG